MIFSSRRDFLLSVGAVPLLRRSQRPNVLLFMTDQESAMLKGPVKRPAYDQLRNRGVEFSHMFCNTPQCSPARGALLTGLEPHHNGVLTNVDKSSLGKPLPPGLPTVGTSFQEAGYKTGYFGKWHLGNESTGPDAFGFGEYQPGSDESASHAAALWIKKQRGPWLAWVSVLNPHDVYQFIERRVSIEPRAGIQPPLTMQNDLAGKPSPQSKYLRDDQGKPTLDYTAADWIKYRSFYASLLEKADRCLATTLESVEKPDNTIVAYTSDHGDALGEHGLPFKGPFMYEPLIRVPLVIAGPGIKKNTVRSDFVTSVDIAPTLTGLAGFPWKTATDGKDLSKGASGRDAVFLEYYGKQHWVEPIRTIRTQDWKLNRYGNGESELYDLKNDPTETRNTAGNSQVAAIEQRLNTRLSHWWSASQQLR